MKLTGKEYVSLCAEESNKPIWTITQLTLNQLLNFHILNNIKAQIKECGKPKKYEINSLIINEQVIEKGTRINAKFRVTLRNKSEKHKNPKKFEYVYSYLDIADFYNCVLDLFFNYAKAFNTDVSNIKIDFIKLEIIPSVTFTNKGFINSNVLAQYDLDGQISMLAFLLKTQKWEIINNTIVFKELFNDRYVETITKLFNSECVISTELERDSAICYCTLFGTEHARKATSEKLKRENLYKTELEKIINNNKEFYKQNLRKYETKFDKEENYDEY